MTRTLPTARQLLILADRAERGQLTADEATRLRAGIRAMESARRSAAGSAGLVAADYRRTRRQLAAVNRLLRQARYRGRQTIRVQTLANTLDDYDQTIKESA